MAKVDKNIHLLTTADGHLKQGRLASEQPSRCFKTPKVIRKRKARKLYNFDTTQLGFTKKFVVNDSTGRAN